MIDFLENAHPEISLKLELAQNFSVLAWIGDVLRELAMVEAILRFSPLKIL